MKDEARKEAERIIDTIEDKYIHLLDHGDAGAVLDDEATDLVSAALIAAEERGWDECNEAWKKDAATEGIVLSHADGEPWFRAKDGHILDDKGMVRKVLVQIDATERDTHDVRVEVGESLLILAAAESAAKGEQR